MKLLTSPLFLRGTLVFFVAAFAFVMTIVLMRRIRRSLVQPTAALGESPSSLESLPLQTYHAVIQELKQQKHELSAFRATQLPSGAWRLAAPDGEHDDTVISLALSWEAVSNNRIYGGIHV